MRTGKKLGPVACCAAAAMIFLQPAAPLPEVPQENEAFPTGASGVIRDLQEAIAAGKAGEIAAHFSRQVYLDLHGAEEGYFSANQAQFVLQKFLAGRRVVSFRFSTTGVSDSIPYATGGGVWRHRGTQASFQVYLSLARTDGRWRVSQFNVY